MRVNVELLSIGNELLNGKIQNTNSHWLTRQITRLGANVSRITVIPDTIPEISNALLEAITRKPDFVITTGGLGPTFDDKTFQGVAFALNRRLEINAKALEMVKEKCAQYARKRKIAGACELTAPRIKMATLPEGTEPMRNPIGTAPGLIVNLSDIVLYVLPGVPAEMRAIFKDTIVPAIKKLVGDYVFCEQRFFAENIVESRLAPLIDRVMGQYLEVYIKSHPIQTKSGSRIEVHLTITASRVQNPAERVFEAAKELARLVEENEGMVSGLEKLKRV
jgi:nicotinamide-nucleotide amidase